MALFFKEDDRKRYPTSKMFKITQSLLLSAMIAIFIYCIYGYFHQFDHRIIGVIPLLSAVIFAMDVIHYYKHTNEWVKRDLLIASSLFLLGIITFLQK